MGHEDHLRNLTSILQGAHAGEMAAAYAYRGHWKSLRDPAERDTVARIEREEWEHRRIVRRMLDTLGKTPVGWQEAKAWVIGRVLGPLCSVAGRHLPMYFAWLLEVQNIDAYDAAVAHARGCGHPEFLEELAHMAAVEREHERFFSAVLGR